MILNKCILTDLGSVNRGKSKHRPRNDESLFGGNYPFIQTGEVKSANFYLRDYKNTYNEKGLAQSKLWDKETLLITIAANIAETAILDIKACFPDSIIGFIPYENKSDVKFVKYYLDYIKKKLQMISQGTTQDNMSVEKLTSMSLFVPKYKHQVKIANLLSNYDNLIENNNTRIKLLENMAKELYKEWFVRLRFPNYQNTKIVDGVPEGWEYKNLFDISDVLYGYPLKSSLFNANKKGEALVRIRDIKNNTTKTFTTERIEDKKYYLKNGDFIVGMDGDFHVGKWSGGKAILNQRVVCFRVNNFISKYFFYFSVKKDIDYLNDVITGTTVAHLSDRDLKKINILIPSKKIIDKFKSLADDLYKLEIDLKVKNQNLKETRDLLLPRLISGKLDIENLNIV